MHAVAAKHPRHIPQRADGTWTAAISVGYTDTGKRRRKTVYGKTKAETQEKLRRLQDDAASGQLTDAGKLKVAEYLARWLEDTVRPNRTPATYSSYEGVVRLHVNPRVGGVRLAKLTAVQVQAVYSGMERDGASPRMRELTHSVLRRAMVRAVKQSLVVRNPCDAVERPRVPRKEMKTLTPEQSLTLLREADGHRLEALFVLAVSTGMRQGELFGLRWEDVDLKAGVVSVQRTLEEIKGKLRLKEPKSEKNRRQIDLPAFAVEAIVRHKARMMTEGFLAGPLFPDTAGGWLRKSTFTRNVFKPLLKKAKLPDVRFHDLRHGHATLMLSLGEHPKVVQERLGHSQISVTLDTYSHVLPSVHRGAAAKIDEEFRRMQG